MGLNILDRVQRVPKVSHQVRAQGPIPDKCCEHPIQILRNPNLYLVSAGLGMIMALACDVTMPAGYQLVRWASYSI